MASVEIKGRSFEITEPSTGVLLRLLNVVGKVGLRADREVAAALREFGGEGVDAERKRTLQIMALLSECGEEDLLRFGAAILQFENEKDGMRWLRENGLPLRVLLEAALLTVEQSQDLLGVLAGFLERVTGVVTAALPTRGLPETPSV